MEFVCVLSVSGSLVSYIITEETEETYIASLKTASIKGNDIPETIALKKENGGWKADPWYDEIIPGLTNCIEAKVEY